MQRVRVNVSHSEISFPIQKRKEIEGRKNSFGILSTAEEESRRKSGKREKRSANFLLFEKKRKGREGSDRFERMKGWRERVARRGEEIVGMAELAGIGNKESVSSIENEHVARFSRAGARDTHTHVEMWTPIKGTSASGGFAGVEYKGKHEHERRKGRIHPGGGLVLEVPFSAAPSQV